MAKDDIGADPPQPEEPVTLRSFSIELCDHVSKPSWLDRLTKATREAPIQSLIAASLIGAMLARRR